MCGLRVKRYGLVLGKLGRSEACPSGAQALEKPVSVVHGGRIETKEISIMAHDVVPRWQNCYGKYI